MSKYVWCEDSGSGFDFWKILFHELDSDIVVQSKKNNTGLRKAVSGISENTDDLYFILIDNAVDNPDVLREVKKLIDISKDKKNVKLVRIHSFEFSLLSFTELEDWIFAKQDELKEKRSNLIHWKNVFVNSLISLRDAEILNEVKAALQYGENYNSEQVSAKLLYEITRNTGFETSKGKIGDCFVVDCCNWEFRETDDICGLDEKRMTVANKMRNIYEKSVLKSALTEAGL